MKEKKEGFSIVFEGNLSMFIEKIEISSICREDLTQESSF